ncbi:MAG: DUF72 domain-containing protein [Candidatus Aenigmarchaeota archaeon]|nr:DUF72 domain-containing protein [Candidatus Aenigmarchaeota archaeon]
MEILVGCCGFCMAKIKYYQHFETVEIQKTFYQLIDEKLAKKWRKEAPENFEFTVKAFQGITHTLKSPTWKKCNLDKEYLSKIKDGIGYLRPAKHVFEFWDKTLKIAKILKSKIVVIQLPKSFKPTEENIKNAKDFLNSVTKRKVTIAIELRGWDNRDKEKLMINKNITIIGDVISEIPIPQKIVYLRLHGQNRNGKINYKYEYSNKELKEIVEYLINTKLDSYVMFNNIFMKRDAIKFKNIIQKVYQR